jgi:hypothetical protein
MFIIFFMGQGAPWEVKEYKGAPWCQKGALKMPRRNTSVHSLFNKAKPANNIGQADIM